MKTKVGMRKNRKPATNDHERVIAETPIDGGTKLLKEIGDLSEPAFVGDDFSDGNAEVEEDELPVLGDISRWIQFQPTLSFIGGNRNTVTAVSACPSRVFFGDKSGTVYAVETATQRKHKLEPQHKGAVLALAVSDVTNSQLRVLQTNDRSSVDTLSSAFVASGGADNLIHVWKRETLDYVGVLRSHQGPVTGLCFRLHTNTLYSCSSDGCIRSWSVAESLVTERLYGHKGAVHCISALSRERCTTGGMDRIPRFWKVDAGTTTEYSSQVTSIESTCMLDDSLVVFGCQDGTITVFDVSRRTPLTQKPFAHGYNDRGDGTGLEKEIDPPKELRVSEENRLPLLGNAISSLAGIPYQLLFASGSCDGKVRLWQFDKAQRCIALLREISVPGFVNSLSFNTDQTQLVVATSKEPRLGRWTTKSSVLNGVIVVAAGQERRLKKRRPTARVAMVADEEFAPVKASKLKRIREATAQRTEVRPKKKQRR